LNHEDDAMSASVLPACIRAPRGKTTQARKLLATVYRRFTEGFDTADLVTAKALLQSLR